MYNVYLAENNAMNFVLVERVTDFKAAIVDWDLLEDDIDGLCKEIESGVLPYIYDEEPWKDDIDELIENTGLFAVRRLI